MTCNAEMGPSEVRDFCKTDASGERLLKAANQVAEAVQYRPRVGM